MNAFVFRLLHLNIKHRLEKTNYFTTPIKCLARKALKILSSEKFCSRVLKKFHFLLLFGFISQFVSWETGCCWTRNGFFFCSFIRNQLIERFGCDAKRTLIILQFLFFSGCLIIFKVVAGISVFFICTSVISFCLKTLPGLRVEIPLTFNHTSSNLSDIYQASSQPPSTTEANFITTTSTQRSFHGGGLLNRYSVRMEILFVLLLFDAW